MIVTAEPYYAVTQPSDVVVMENLVRPDTRGVIESINAKYELLPRGMYSSQGHAPGFSAIQVGKKDPFELYEAENAVQLARIAGADRYAADSFRKAQDALDQAMQVSGPASRTEAGDHHGSRSVRARGGFAGDRHPRGAYRSRQQ